MTPRLAWLPLLATLLVMSLWAPRAAAYPWMIRHGYTGCSTCHSDPSGGTLLTTYGRAQSQLLLSTRWTAEAAEAPGDYSSQFFGLPLPKEVLAGFDLRDAYMWNFAGGELVDHRVLLMRTDAMTQIKISRLRLYGSLGYAREASALNSQRAWVTQAAEWGNVVSREHWIGYDLTDHALLRVGRLMQPFGVRTIDHTLWVRAATDTDINQAQQHGVSLAYDGAKWRTEALAILGNFQVSPDSYRERGAAAYAEFYPTGTWSLGASAKATHAATDLVLRRAATRQAYGLMGRYRPVQALVLTGELDLLLRNFEGNPDLEGGHASMLQADLELVPGVHLLGAGESVSLGDGAGTAIGGWLTAWWFPIAHTDLRLDFVSRTLPGGDAATQTVLLQGHLYL